MVIGNNLHPILCGLTLSLNKGNVKNAINNLFYKTVFKLLCTPAQYKTTTVTLAPNVGHTLDRESYHLEKEPKVP